MTRAAIALLGTLELYCERRTPQTLGSAREAASDLIRAAAQCQHEIEELARRRAGSGC
jgi:hypothetical protein